MNEVATPNSPEATTLRCLADAAHELAGEPNASRALWKLICKLRTDLDIDRAGVFTYEPQSDSLQRMAGTDEHGEPEFEGPPLPVSGGVGPLAEVARRDRPYYFSENAPEEYPHVHFAPGVRAHVILPIVAGNVFLGVLCADNALSGRSIARSLLVPLQLYAGLAALPLFVRYQQMEQERADTIRRHIHREVLFSATNGKIILCDREEIDAEWPTLQEPLPLQHESHVRGVREAVKQMAAEAGMADERTGDFALAASEAATNALLHGKGGAACLACQDGRVRVRIADWGEGILPENLPRATLMKGWSGRASMGLGFTLIHEVSDRVFLHTGSEGTTVIIEMAVQPQPVPELNPLLWGDELLF